MDKLLHTSLSPSFLPSDSPLANDLNDIDEQEIWEIEVGSRSLVDDAKPSLPPRNFPSSRRSPSVAESRSPLNDAASSPWLSPAVNGLGNISGMSTSPHATNGNRSTALRILTGDSTPARRISSVSRVATRMGQPQPHGDGVAGGDIGVVIPQSAPVNIPVWSKMQSRGSRHHHHQPHLPGTSWHDDSEEEDKERLPPHEFLAREYARSQKTSSSVLEGAGRTLKGRDLSRVRNAVFTYTGFLE